MTPKREGPRILRGGAWNYDGTENFRCAYRSNSRSTERYHNFGFRPAREADEEDKSDD